MRCTRDKNTRNQRVFGIAETEVERVRSAKRLLIELDGLGCIANITHYGLAETDDQATRLELE